MTNSHLSEIIANQNRTRKTTTPGLNANIDTIMGGSRISGKGVHVYKGVGVRFADFTSFVLNIP